MCRVVIGRVRALGHLGFQGLVPKNGSFVTLGIQRQLPQFCPLCRSKLGLRSLENQRVLEDVQSKVTIHFLRGYAVISGKVEESLGRLIVRYLCLDNRPGVVGPSELSPVPSRMAGE